jgi:hypothetical protein
MRYGWLVLTFCFMLLSFPTTGQQNPTSSPQAVSLATNALAALNGATQVNDVTLTGTGMRTAGSDVASGNVTLKALGKYQSRLDLAVSGGTLSDIFNLSSDKAPQGFWVGTDGKTHQVPYHNALAGAVWFFPALSVLSQVSNPSFTITYLGSETMDGESVQHLRFIFQSPSTSVSSNLKLARLSATEVYLDPLSYLPVALVFNTHPDNNMLTDIPVEIVFSNYQTVRGVQIPFRIQKFLNGSLFLDVTIQAAELNTGLTDSAFTSN